MEELCDSIVRGPFGSALKVSFFVDKGSDTVKVYEQKNAIQRSATLGDSYVTQEKYNELKRFECGPGDFIMSCSGTIGCLYQLPDDAEPGIINQALCKFHLNGKMLPEVFLTYMRNSVDQLETKGSAIKNIGAVSFIKNMEIALPPIAEQEAFAEFIRQSDKSKFIRFKSQFIEMFGELGSDYKGWGLTTLGQCCELNPKRPRDIDDELMVSFVPMPAVSEDGKMDCSNIRPYKEVRKGFTYFAEDDVLFAKITPCMENGKGAVARGLEGGIGSGSTEFHVLRPIAGKSNPYWLYIITMFDSFRIGARKVMTGTGGQLRVPIGYLNDYPISLPPIELQKRFEEFIHQSDKSKYSRS